jgi:hypothetical protein
MRTVIKEIRDGYSIRYHEDAILRQLNETLNTIDNVLNRHNNNHV